MKSQVTNANESTHQSDGMETTSEVGGLTATAPSFNLTSGQGFPVQAKLDPSATSPIQREASPTVSRGGGTHTVTRGESLWRISENVYGHGRYWRRIADANPDVVRGRSLIYPNDELALPVIEVPIGEALEGARDNPEELRDLASSIPDDNYDAFWDQLSQDQMEADAEFLQMVDMMRNSNMTMDQLSDEQTEFMEAEAARRGMTIGEFIADETASRGYGGGSISWWPSLSPSEQRDWRRRFRAAVQSLRRDAPENVRRVIREAESNGGGFQWAPEDAERLGAFGFTRSDWTLYVGQHWLEAYEDDPERVYANIVHEMGGHNEYGNTLGWDVMEGVLSDMPADEHALATGGGNSVYSAYGYMETEIWAELREHEFDRDDNPTDHPFERPSDPGSPSDVRRQLERIQHAFDPVVAESLVRSMYRRASHDDRITPDSLRRFADAINTVFGFTP